MFAYFAAALGGCKVITEEDSGEFFVSAPDLKRPDFRFVANDGHEYLIEVKNFNPAEPCTDFSLKADYAQSLQRYAEAFHEGVPENRIILR
jgi:hypothetical protein